MFENRLSAERLDSLSAGDAVLIETWRAGWRGPAFGQGSVVRTTPTQIVVERMTERGTSYEERYRKKDAGLVGSDDRAELVDPDHERTQAGLAQALRSRRQGAIDSLAHRWSRNHGDLEVLRELHAAIGEYLDAES